MYPHLLALVLAIGDINPRLSADTVHTYAMQIEASGRENSIDPWAIVSIIERETGFRNVVAVERNGLCAYGLGQHNRRCGSVEGSALMDPYFNIEETAHLLDRNRRRLKRVRKVEVSETTMFQSYNGGASGYGWRINWRRQQLKRRYCRDAEVLETKLELALVIARVKAIDAEYAWATHDEPRPTTEEARPHYGGVLAVLRHPWMWREP